MNFSIANLDDVTIQKIMLQCSDAIIASVMISLNASEITRVMSLLSKEQKAAIQSELKVLEHTGYYDGKEVIQGFWERVRSLEAQGEIILNHTKGF